MGKTRNLNRAARSRAGKVLWESRLFKREQSRQRQEAEGSYTACQGEWLMCLKAKDGRSGKTGWVRFSKGSTTGFRKDHRHGKTWTASTYHSDSLL